MLRKAWCHVIEARPHSNRPVPPLFRVGDTVTVRALLLGSRLNAPAQGSFQRLGEAPLVLACPNRGCAVIFRYGALVLFGVDEADERTILQASSVKDPLETPERESVELRVDGDDDSGPTVEEGVIYIPRADVPHLQVIAEALAKHVVLSHYESTLASIFDRIEPLAQDLNEHGSGGRRVRELLEHIGGALLSEQRMVGRVEVREKPEVLWEHGSLERFYARLDREYELRARAAGLERKLDLISRTAKTSLELLQERRQLRVEWYIVILIVVEIMLTVYGMLAAGGGSH